LRIANILATRAANIYEIGSMIPIKIQCGCGQRYAFDIEPVNGLMPAPVACPVCGADGTAVANEIIAQTLAAQPAVVRPAVAAIRPAASSPAAQPGPIRPNPPTASRGRDGWATEETQLNKLGTWIMVTPALLAALLAWGIIRVEIPFAALCIIVGVGGLAGGALNILGRGPVAVGAFIGLLIALGGYGAVCWWLHDRKVVQKYELLIAFGVGAAPGFILQYVFQRILQKRSSSE
jgi:hypothetical protein